MNDTYNANDLMRIAKRYNNNRRSYLLINPLQGKHLPVRPSSALAMMETFGKKLREHAPNAPLVIGFAETATAIGAVAAKTLNAYYIHTTREPLPDDYEYLSFDEEHSHAVEQKLYLHNIAAVLRNASTIILIDDELSTGKTMRNAVEKLRSRCPFIKGIKTVAASLLYRLTETDEALLKAANIEPLYLVRPNTTDFDATVQKFTVEPPPPINEQHAAVNEQNFSHLPPHNPRLGVNATQYFSAWEDYAEQLLCQIKKILPQTPRSVLVLGTEECMLPALLIGRRLESFAAEVFCHATTRSPIGICRQDNYPVTHGRQIAGMYDSNRQTFVYNLTNYDLVVVVSDATPPHEIGKAALRAALTEHNCKQIFWIGG